MRLRTCILPVAFAAAVALAAAALPAAAQASGSGSGPGPLPTAPYSGFNPVLARAPYVTDLAQTSAVVTWATNQDIHGTLYYGPARQLHGQQHRGDVRDGHPGAGLAESAEHLSDPV